MVTQNRLYCQEPRAESFAELVVELMSLHESMIRRMIRARLDRRLSRRLDEDDVMQEALVNALSRSAVDRTTGPSLAWLMKIIGNTITDLHRRHCQSKKRSVSRVQSLTLSDNEGEDRFDAPHRITPHDELVARESRRQVRDAVGRLGERDQAVLYLRYNDQLTNEQTARALDIRPKAASIRLRRALDRLRRQLETCHGREVTWTMAGCF